jgi:Uma2 family endonuclease
MRLTETYIAQLADYVKKNLKKGYTKESLKWALVNQGHSKIEVEKAMAKVERDLAAEAPVLRTKPEIKVEIVSPEDAVVKKKSFWRRLFGL